MKKKSEVTNQEILQAIQGYSTEIEKDLSKIKDELKGVKDGIIDLRHGQSDMMSKINNVAYKFEFRDLEKRVEALEAK